MNVLPDHEPILLRCLGAYDLHLWALVLGVVPNIAVLTWPVKVDQDCPSCTMFCPRTDAGAEPEWLHFVTTDIEVWCCEWRSPWEQNTFGGAGGDLIGALAGLRLCTRGPPPESLFSAPTRNGCWATPVHTVRKCARFEGLGEMAATKVDAEFLEQYILHHHPHLTALQLYVLLLGRVDEQTCLEPLMSDEEFAELLDRTDREKLERE